MGLRNILLQKTKRAGTLGFFLSSAFVILSSGCATSYQNPYMTNLIPSSQYYSTVEDYTETKKVYDGFYQTLELSATLLNTKVSREQLDHRARVYQWTPDQYSSAKSETETSLSQETKVFLSFFVPERKHDDLSKPNTTWKIFLDAGDKRYEGKASKMKNIFADIVSLYPTHNRFSTAYMITFPVPVSRVENGPSRLTFTGPVGSTTVEFSEMK